MQGVERSFERASTRRRLKRWHNGDVAEEPVPVQQEARLAVRTEPIAATISRGLAALDRSVVNAPDAGDQLPQGYESIRNSAEYKQAAQID